MSHFYYDSGTEKLSFLVNKAWQLTARDYFFKSVGFKIDEMFKDTTFSHMR